MRRSSRRSSTSAPWGCRWRKADVRVSWLQALPKSKRHSRRYAPLHPFAMRSFDLRGYDVVITSGSAFAKGVRVPPSALHLCYCYSPMRWAWSFEQHADRAALTPSARVAPRLALPALRRWDFASARNVSRFVAVSTEVSERIRTTYGRGSEIVFPPVDVGRFRHDRPAGDDFLVVSRLDAYKRIDLAVRACTTLGLPLLVVGDGPGARDAAVDRRTDGALRRQAHRSRGHVAVRALPRTDPARRGRLRPHAPGGERGGPPVVAFARGGALDTVRDGETGVLFTRTHGGVARGCVARPAGAELGRRAPPRARGDVLGRGSSFRASAPCSRRRWSSGSWAASGRTTRRRAHRGSGVRGRVDPINDS
jgi:glycosyltransferase involved in cell wall biosynthesis